MCAGVTRCTFKHLLLWGRTLTPTCLDSWRPSQGPSLERCLSLRPRFLHWALLTLGMDDSLLGELPGELHVCSPSSQDQKSLQAATSVSWGQNPLALRSTPCSTHTLAGTLPSFFSLSRHKCPWPYRLALRELRIF